MMFICTLWGKKHFYISSDIGWEQCELLCLAEATKLGGFFYIATAKYSNCYGSIE